MSERVLKQDAYTQLKDFVKGIDDMHPMEFGTTEVVFGSLPEFQTYARNSFKYEESLHSVEFPEGLTEVPEGYFLSCKNLERVVLPSTLEKIGDYAFYNCVSLKEIVFPMGLREIGEFSFCGCTGLEKLHIPQNVRKIGDAAFSECKNLKNLSFGFSSSITELGSHIVQFCDSLEEFFIPPHVSEIKTGALYDCHKIAHLRIPKETKKVSVNAFFHSSLTNVVFMNGETMLAPGALNGLTQGEIFLENDEGAKIPVPIIAYEEEMSVLSLIEEGKKSS